MTDPIADILSDDRGLLELEREPPPPDVALQRVCVRMLFDPRFVAAVYDDPHEALSGLNVPAQLIDQLVTNDRRLWAADRLRRRRALKALMQEFEVSSALVLAETRSLGFLEDFFSHSTFHRAVQRRGYMALAFAAYLEDRIADGTLRSAHTRAALTIEAGMATSRREVREARRGRDRARIESGREKERLIATRPGTLSVATPAGVLEVIQHIQRFLFEAGLTPALGLCDDAPRPDPLPPLDSRRTQSWLLEGGAELGKVEISEIPHSFHVIISGLRRPGTPERLAETIGEDPTDVAEAVSQLMDAGVLRYVAAD